MHPTIILTRHGLSVHNVRDAEGNPIGDHFYDYGNDDLLTLTEQGIQETTRLAEKLAAALPAGAPTDFYHSPSLRTIQTISILRLELLRSFGFSRAHLGTAHQMNWLREIPVEPHVGMKDRLHFMYLRHPDNRFDYDAFASDVDYTWDGGRRSFASEFRYRSEMFNHVDKFGKAAVMVGHYHGIGAIIGQMVLQWYEPGAFPDGRPTKKLLAAAHSLHVDHGVLYDSRTMWEPGHTVREHFRNHGV